MAGNVKLFIFGLTPRAGRHHHVFLLPNSDTEARRTAERLAPRVQTLVEKAKDSVIQDRDILVLWHKAIQPPTGREAYEWLCIHLPNRHWKGLRENTRTFLKNIHKDFRGILDKKHWESADLYEVMPELQRWAKEITELVNPDELTTEYDMPRRSTARRPYILVGSMILVTVLCSLVVCQTPFCRRIAKLIRISEPPANGREKNLKDLAEALRIHNVNDVTLREEILGKLEQLYTSESPEPPDCLQ